MNREQQAVLSLLKEIDAICKKNKITYYLSPELTLYAMRNQPFPKNPMAGRLLMKIEDMENFRRAVEGEARENRILESMRNNERFPGFYLRYTNTATLCFRLNEGRNFKYPGMGIDIYPLRGKMTSRKKHLWNRLLETGWKQLGDSRSEEEEKSSFMCRLLVRILCIGGRKRLGEKLYDKFAASQNVPGTKEYVVRLKKRTIYYPSEIFKKTCKVTLAGEKFTAPKDKDGYLRCRYGNDYEKNAQEQFTPSLTVLTSALVSCGEFFQEAGSPDELVKERKRLYKKDAKGRKRRVYLDWAWNDVKFTAQKLETAGRYRENRDYLINLYENRDFVRLEEAFSSYTKIMKRCLEEGDVYAPDRQIMDIYMNLLEKTGKQKMKEKIMKNWKREDDFDLKS